MLAISRGPPISRVDIKASHWTVHTAACTSGGKGAIDNLNHKIIYFKLYELCELQLLIEIQNFVSADVKIESGCVSAHMGRGVALLVHLVKRGFDFQACHPQRVEGDLKAFGHWSILTQEGELGEKTSCQFIIMVS